MRSMKTGFHYLVTAMILPKNIVGRWLVYVSARLSKLPVGEWCTPIGQQSSQGVHLETGTFPFANRLVCEKGHDEGLARKICRLCR
jgi:hypothetical protein